MHSTSAFPRPSTPRGPFAGGAPTKVMRGVAQGRRSLLEALLLIALAAGALRALEPFSAPGPELGL